MVRWLFCCATAEPCKPTTDVEKFVFNMTTDITKGNNLYCFLSFIERDVFEVADIIAEYHARTNIQLSTEDVKTAAARIGFQGTMNNSKLKPPDFSGVSVQTNNSSAKSYRTNAIERRNCSCDRWDLRFTKLSCFAYFRHSAVDQFECRRGCWRVQGG